LSERPADPQCYDPRSSKAPISQALHRFFPDEERASNIIVWGCGAVAALCFVASLVAMGVLK
jgi:hypothetical protein